MTSPTLSKPLLPLEPPIVLLSASVPSAERGAEYRRNERANVEIDAAVISMARATLAAGGSLVFGGHPSISPLVATVAVEYLDRNRLREGFAPECIRIYQSEAYRGFAPDATLALLRMSHVYIRWTEAKASERFTLDLPKDRPRCPQSLAEMRRLMIEESRPDALVCIGGMEGVEDEFQAFDAWRREQKLSSPVYVIAATGGAAELLAEHRAREVRVIDREILTQLSKVRKHIPRAGVTPYPLIMQTLIQEIAGNNDRIH